MNKESPQTSPNAGYSLDTSPPPSLILSLSEEDSAPTVEYREELASDVNTQSISTCQEECMLKQKVASQVQTAANSYASKPNTKKQISDYSSWLTTTQPNSSDSATPSGPQSRDFNGPLGKRYPVVGPKADTHDEGKAPLAQLPWAAVEAMSRVQLYGHKKYKDFHNYRKGMEVSRNLSCALRHIKEYMEGHDVDVESGESPLAHAMTRVAFVLQNIHDGTAVDDRYKKT